MNITLQNESIKDFFTGNNELISPCVVLDTDVVSSNFKNLSQALPFAQCYYSVKANAASEVLLTLFDNGSFFDAASIYEVRKCLQLNIPPSSIHYGNTIKKIDEIKEAYHLGITSFSVDSTMEIEKIQQSAPGAKVMVRLSTSGEGAAWPLAEKFGRSEHEVYNLLVHANQLGLEPWGICFHVGSQQKRIDAWAKELEIVARIREKLARRGIEIQAVNLGGGFPCHYSEQVPSIESFGDAIKMALQRCGLSNLHIMIEPGRFLVASAGVILCEVVLVIHNKCHSTAQWVYLDIGQYNGLTESGAIRWPILTEKDKQERVATILAGPTCDSTDVLGNKCSYYLPRNLDCGDRLVMLNAGAYTASYSTVSFNGFEPLHEYFVGRFASKNNKSMHKLSAEDELM